MRKIVIDKNKCIGCGACTAIASKTFMLGEDGKSQIIDQQGDAEETVNTAIENCPVKAVSCED